MKFKIEFVPSRYFDGEPAYSLMYESVYDNGGLSGYSPMPYWVSSGYFTSVEAAKKAAAVVKQFTEAITFEV